MMLLNIFQRWMAGVFMLGIVMTSHAQEAPDKLIQRVTEEVLASVRANTQIRQGDVQTIRQLVDDKIVPHLDFERTTALAAGRYWREASDEQKGQLQKEFKALLIHTYSGALAQVKDRPIIYDPLRGGDGKDVVVNAHTAGAQGQRLDFGYRLRLLPEGWKVYDVNVLGVWMLQVYRDNFATVIRQSGIDGLIQSLAEKNQAFAAREAATGRAATPVRTPD